MQSHKKQKKSQRKCKKPKAATEEEKVKRNDVKVWLKRRVGLQNRGVFGRALTDCVCV